MSRPPTSQALVPVKTMQQEFGWRNTPKVNFAPERRSLPLTPGGLLLLLLLVAALFALQTSYGWQSDARRDVANATQQVEATMQAISEERSNTRQAAQDFEALAEENERIREQDASVFEVYDQLTRKRPQWATALQALLQAERPGFELVKLEAGGPPAQFALTANAATSADITGFLKYMEEARDFLELAGLNSEEGGPRESGTLRAVVRLK